MILADNEKDRRAALKKLLPLQREDFAGVFKAMDGLPVTIRTLDPPLHEFLPRREDLMVEIATLRHANAKEKKALVARYSSYGAKGVGDLKRLLPTLLARVEQLHEFNPMLGHRGCRLGITYPEITEMQARAIFEAAVDVTKKGVKVLPEVMIPLVATVKEIQRKGNESRLPGWYDDRVAARGAGGGRDCEGSGVLLVRHQRFDADHFRLFAR